MLRKVLVEVCRVLLGLVFIFSGLVKSIDPVGGAIKIGEYLDSFHLPHTATTDLYLSMGLSGFEFILGAFILMGIYRRISSKLIFAVMCFMTLLTLYLALFNPVSDCGCFGDAVKLTNWETFAKNLILLPASYYYMKYPRLCAHLFSSRGRWLPGIIAVCGIVYFMVGNYMHLPIKDFRPYKVGADLRALTHIPPGAPTDEYEHTFVYKKEGEQKVFDMNDLPDSSWSFVERRDKLIKKGYTPPINDFALFDDEGENIADTILADSKGVIMLMAPHWSGADQSKIAQISEVYNYAEAHGYRFYGVSGSSDRDMSQWKYQTGADYPMLFMDATTVKTVVRGNPGLVLLKDGKIIDKINFYDFPAVNDVPTFFKQEFEEMNPHDRHKSSAILLYIWSGLVLIGLIRRIIRENRIAFKKNK